MPGTRSGKRCTEKRALVAREPHLGLSSPPEPFGTLPLTTHSSLPLSLFFSANPQPRKKIESPHRNLSNRSLPRTVGNVPGTSAGINLELDLDAYTDTSPLTLIDAPDGHLFGVFCTVTFLGTTIADINYDYPNGDVFLSNFQIGSGAGTASRAGSAVPEPSGLALTLTLTLGLCCCPHSVRRRNGSRPGRHRLRRV